MRRLVEGFESLKRKAITQNERVFINYVEETLLKKTGHNREQLIIDVCKNYAAIKGCADTHHQWNVLTRYSVFIVLRTRTGLSLTQIGSTLNRHHSTVVHAMNEYDKWMSLPDIYAPELEAVSDLNDFLDYNLKVFGYDD